ncbi:hypothetical protein [Kitasatospora sp. NBC_01302]|uniref:hypothetical protein n=1 Tax=Kitasatospora sp. NBC_01302 TaxID=2903575 RepID=UPI002E12D4CA|nr:hypothetical protein OG294_14080 [Kitasatospora sp. NBC_01302]
MADFSFGHGPGGPWIGAPLGRIDVTSAEFAAALEQHGVEVVHQEPFAPRMELGWNDCDPVATCHCDARCVGDSVNDAVLAWAAHLTAAHKGEW